MSYLAQPRVSFMGADAMVNPSTANNNDVVNILDYDNVQLRNPQGLDPAAYRAWLMSLVTQVSPASDGEPAETSVTMPGFYNYYGDHATTFGSAKTTSVRLFDGRLLMAGTDSDPLLGAHVSINGVMVDLDPADTYSTQIITGTFKVTGADAGGHPLKLIQGAQPTIACSRWLNFFRPKGAAIFQCVIPTERLEFDEAARSLALDALREEIARRGAGMVVRYCLYALQTAPTLSDEDVARSYRRGDYIANPRYGMVVGSFGVWYGEDMRSAPVGRLLYPPASPYCTPAPAEASPGAGAILGEATMSPDAPAAARFHIKTHADVERVWHRYGQAPATLGAADSASPLPPFVLGPAVVLVDRQRQVVVLDLLSTFPETSPDDRTKVDRGPVQLRLDYTNAQGQPQSAIVGLVAYDRQTYEALGGVVEVSYAERPELGPYIESGALRLCLQAAPDQALLREIAAVQVETDDRCVYFQQGQPGTIGLRVFAGGQPTQEPVRIRLEQWKDYNRADPIDESARPYPVAKTPFFGFERVKLRDPARAIPSWITVPAGGQARLRFNARLPGCYKIRFIPPGAPVDRKSPDFATEFFANVRVLPKDDYSGYSDEQINSWPFMYEHVFGYYSLMYPIMSTIIPWGPEGAPDNPERVQEFAALIRQFVDEQVIDTTMYMPITRELSAGKRRLIQRWCDLQLRET